MLNLIKKNIFLLLFLTILIFLSIIYPHNISQYPDFVDWQTVITIGGLLIITTGFRESKFFDSFLKSILKKLKNERRMAIVLILLSALFSTFLTNDITLFIFIPLIISMQNLIHNDISKLVIFSAISVNAGSALTPIGNPQNLFLWHKWGISSIIFISKMFPLVTILILILLIFTWFAFPKKEISLSKDITVTKPHKSLFFFSLAMMFIFLVSLDFNHSWILLAIIFVLYLIFFRKILLESDWIIILMIILMFVDFHIISTIPVVNNFIKTIDLSSSNNVFLVSVAISQLISNVPAGIFISKFSHNWYAITYGVNIGGNGLVIGSLANLIALRMVKKEKIYWQFHKYSLLYLLISGGFAYLCFFIL